jgi:hypothetical protein
MTLVKTADLEVIRLLFLAGKEDPIHTVPDEITGHPWKGVKLPSRWQHTRGYWGGPLFYLASGEPHLQKALEYSSLVALTWTGWGSRINFFRRRMHQTEIT